MARSHTRKGPGRSHGQCQLIVDPTNGKHLGVRSPGRKLQIANFGGNWKGKEYLSYREHDMLTRLTVLYCERPPLSTSQALAEIAAARK